MTQPQALQSAPYKLGSPSHMAAMEAATLAAERREDARKPDTAVAVLSQHVDAIEAHVDQTLTFWSLVEANPQALSNLLARLKRVQETIEVAARK